MEMEAKTEAETPVGGDPCAGEDAGDIDLSGLDSSGAVEISSTNPLSLTENYYWLERSKPAQSIQLQFCNRNF